MESIGQSCTPLKQTYDKCFNKWYTEKFLKGELEPECDELFVKYKECVMKAIKQRNLDTMIAESHNDSSSFFSSYQSSSGSSSSSSNTKSDSKK
ncbi:hypothetical protein BKA69DRAFT_1072829 [Paraphysoderma sedebokerense]|nr:hypothetical protein BKA69DRAFT_1072829 [Paraphysoderma sedebokerense]